MLQRIMFWEKLKKHVRHDLDISRELHLERTGSICSTLILVIQRIRLVRIILALSYWGPPDWLTSVTDLHLTCDQRQHLSKKSHTALYPSGQWKIPQKLEVVLLQEFLLNMIQITQQREDWDTWCSPCFIVVSKHISHTAAATVELDYWSLHTTGPPEDLLFSPLDQSHTFSTADADSGAHDLSCSLVLRPT